MRNYPKGVLLKISGIAIGIIMWARLRLSLPKANTVGTINKVAIIEAIVPKTTILFAEEIMLRS
jgi:hypothetical protein